jgi:simple sugar transport system permease protein
MDRSDTPEESAPGRTPRDLLRGLLPPLAAVALALVAGSFFILLVGKNPFLVYGRMLEATLGSGYGLGQVLFKATPLIFTGLAVAFAFRAGLFNIGAEGQLYVGAFAMALAGIFLPSAMPWFLIIPLCLLAGAGGGVVFGGIPGWLRAKLGVHEVINTIMMNFIAFIFVNYLLVEYLALHETVHTAPVAVSARIPRLGHILPLFEGSAANLSFLLALACAGLLWFVDKRTALGFRLRAVGLNPQAARNAGINVPAHLGAALAVSGGLAALAGANFVLGYKYYFEQGFSAGAGFMGIAVALLARNHPLGVVGAGLLFGLLSEGGLGINNEVPKELVEILQAVIIIFIVSGARLGESGFLARLRRRKSVEEPGHA